MFRLRRWIDMCWYMLVYYHVFCVFCSMKSSEVENAHALLTTIDSGFPSGCYATPFATGCSTPIFTFRHWAPVLFWFGLLFWNPMPITQTQKPTGTVTRHSGQMAQPRWPWIWCFFVGESPENGHRHWGFKLHLTGSEFRVDPRFFHSKPHLLEIPGVEMTRSKTLELARKPMLH